MFPSYRSNRPEEFCKKDVHFAKFIGKHPFWSLSFNKVAGRTYSPLHSSCLYTEAYSELRWSFLAVNYFRKKLHLRGSTGFWIHFWHTCKKCCRKKWSFLLRHVAALEVRKFGPVYIIQNQDMFEKNLPLGWDCWQIKYL